MSAEWLPARLIPTSGIPERASRRHNLRPTDSEGHRPAPAGTTETYIDVPLTLDGGDTVPPDGLMRVRRGKCLWPALAEVKTGRNELERDQVESYLDVARGHGGRAFPRG